MRAKLGSVWLFGLLLISTNGFGTTYPLPQQGDVIGEIKRITLTHSTDLKSISRKHHVSYEQLKDLNPGLLTDKKLRVGTRILLPTQHVLPAVPRIGMVINLAEQRMYYYPEQSKTVITEPVGIGREGDWQTPTGIAKIIAKEENPSWRPTSNVRAEAVKYGTPIPQVFPPGPTNPMGKYVFRLNWPLYLIHGTNRPEEVGSRVSAGCIRLLPKAIEAIYDKVPVGTQVNIIDVPYKLGWSKGQLFFEAHKPLKETARQYTEHNLQTMKLFKQYLSEKKAWVKWNTVAKQIKQPGEIPIVVGAVHGHPKD